MVKEEKKVYVVKENVKKYIGCYEKNGPIPRVICKYNKNSTKRIPNGKDKNLKPLFKTVSNNGKGFDYEILIEYGKEYKFNLNDPKTKFMVENLIRGGKIKEIIETKEVIEK